VIERDIWRTAAFLIEQFGADAEIEAARRADTMLDRGDFDGQTGGKTGFKRQQRLTVREVLKPRPRPPQKVPAPPWVVVSILVSFALSVFDTIFVRIGASDVPNRATGQTYEVHLGRSYRWYPFLTRSTHIGTITGLASDR